MPAFIQPILGTLEYAFAIITLLGGVIAIHELGHFLFAKWCGIRVDTFSIGFGPKLFAKKFGETEYCLSLIPLGGFVKIYGQDPEELEKDENPTPERAFVKKSLLQKISVLFGGPLFNYLLAIAIFALLAVAGVQKLPAVATRVVSSSPAFDAGLRSGDVILSIDGEKTKTYDEVLSFIAKNPDKTLNFSILRDGLPVNLDIPVQKEHALTPYGEPSIAGLLEGIDPLAREPIMATTVKGQPWGFESGDKILSVSGTAISSWEDLEKVLEKYLQSHPTQVVFEVERSGKKLELIGSIKSSAKYSSAIDFLNKNGIYNPELFIQEVMPDSPAAIAGIKKGDRIVSANGKNVFSFEHLRTVIQNTGESLLGKETANKEATFPIVIEREGKNTTLQSSLKSTTGKDLLGNTIVTYTIGIASDGKPKMPSNILFERTLNPFKALWIGSAETLNHTIMTVVGLKKLAFGEVSAKTVGGPIMIGKIAGDTFSHRGWRDFLRIMAIISISLGVFNLIPIPILDGGHIVFAVVESIRGKPIPQSVQQAALKVGLSLILVLMVFAIYNDVTRVLP
ncbi:MAG: RIP metalloprotease RseP [Oligoflexia bacterium]|nr:RIP metalloprotease RseP [Oligoflexia bacterium]